MQRLQIMVLAILCILANAHGTEAGNRAVNGMLIGAGSGALIGHVAGRDTESVLIGTAVGGAAGYAIGKNSDGPDRVVVHHNSYRPVTRYEQYRPWGHTHHPVPHYRDYRYKYRDNHHWRAPVCREKVTYKQHHGKVTRIVKSTCDSPRVQYRDRDDDDNGYRWRR